jgi:Zn-dependent protease
VFVEPDRTPYDWNFRLWGFNVRVHPLFWVGAVVLGANNLERRDGYGILFLLIWVSVVFTSILVHELGHALAFRRFGTNSHIILWMFGGLAIPHSLLRGRARRIAVAVAGPIAGFLLCGLVYGTNRLSPWASSQSLLPVQYLYLALIFVNLFWGIFNLLPVFPLDGGQICRELCGWKWPGHGLKMALRISVGVAAAVAGFTFLGALGVLRDLPWWAQGSWYTTILFAVLAIQSYLLLKQLEPSSEYHLEGFDDDRPPWR